MSKLVHRRKWTTDTRNLQMGDLVLVVDPDCVVDLVGFENLSCDFVH